MFEINVTFNKDPFQFFGGISAAVTGLADFVAQAAQEEYALTLPPVEQTLRYTLAPGQPPHYTMQNPPAWTSPAQAGAYWASKGFGRGIPTHLARTGASGRGWDFGVVRVSADEVTIYASNPVAHAPFVYGTFDAGNTFQQGFIRALGYPTARPVVTAWFTELVDHLFDRVRVYITQFP